MKNFKIVTLKWIQAFFQVAGSLWL